MLVLLKRSDHRVEEMNFTQLARDDFELLKEGMKFSSKDECRFHNGGLALNYFQITPENHYHSIEKK